MLFQISTPRFILREWNEDDAQFLFHLNEDPAVTLMTGDGSFGSLENATKFIRDYDQYAKYGHGRWLVVDKNNSSPVGWCGLKNQMKELGIIDLGYRFVRDSWGQGIGTETAYFALKAGFEHFNINVITGRASIENQASIRILEKIGMEFYKIDECHGDTAKYFNISSDRFSMLLDQGFYKLSLGFE